ncbi:hypothetical protein OHU17_00970 [Streptomyces goshikiensis]|uniref:Uncharacterized protein n=1 Tax=Streptomyces goshikiensis TaxID=1942 RepID=A0ABZ1RDC8_9ACTN|nr:hypothetical protein [Streptomyces goshikiensis]
MATDSADVPPVIGAPAVVSGPLTSACTGDSVRPVARTPQGHIRETFPEAGDTMGVSVHEGVVPLRDPTAATTPAWLLAEVTGLDVVTAVIEELTVQDG